MGVREWVGGIVGKAPKAEPARQTAISMPFSRQPVRKPNVFLLRNWAENSEWVRAAINVRRLQISQTEYDIVPIDPTQPWDEELQSKIYQLFALPNTKRDSFRSLIEPVVEDVLVLDAGVIEKQLNPKNEPVYLWYADPQWMRVDPTWDGSDPTAPRYFWYPMGSWRASFTNNEVIYIMANPATYRVLGLSPLEVLKDTITADMAAAQYNRDMVTGSPPAGLIDLGEGVDPQQVHQFRYYFDNEVAGRKSLGVIGGTSNAKFIPFGQNNREMQFMQWQIYLVRKIVSVFGISAQDLNLTFDINRATAETQVQMTEDRGLKPLLSLIEEYLNREVVADFVQTDIKKRYARGTITFEEKNKLLALSLVNPRQQRQVAKRLSGIPSLTNLMFEFAPLSVRSYDKQAAINTSALSGLPWMTLNEARSESNLVPIEGGDEIYVMTNLGPIPLSQIANGEMPTNPAVAAMIENLHKMAPVNVFGLPDRKALSPPRPKAAPSPVSVKTRLRAKTTSYFKRFAAAFPVEEVARRVHAASQKSVRKAAGDDAEMDDTISDEIWKFQSSDEAMGYLRDYATDLGDAYRAGYNIGGNAALDQFGAGSAFHLVNEAVMQNLESSALTAASLQLDTASRNMLRDTLSSGLREGSGIDVLASQLRSEMSDWGSGRARLIADNEVNKAMSRASVDTYSRNGIEMDEWDTTGAETVCEICQQNEDDGPTPVEEPFSSGDTEPPAHPDCDCSIKPTIPDDWTMPSEDDSPADGGLWTGQDEDYSDLGLDSCFSSKSISLVRAQPEGDEGAECGFDAAWKHDEDIGAMSSLRERIGSYINNVEPFKEGALEIGPFVKAQDNFTEWTYRIDEPGAQQLRAGAGALFDIDMSREMAFSREAATENEVALAKAVYADTQAYFRAAGIEELTLYRGVQGELADAIRAAKEGGAEFVSVPHNVLSSYANDKDSAAFFAGGKGVVLKITVPVKDIFAGGGNFQVMRFGDTVEWIVITDGERAIALDDVRVRSKHTVLVHNVDTDPANREWAHIARARGYAGTSAMVKQ